MFREVVRAGRDGFLLGMLFTIFRTASVDDPQDDYFLAPGTLITSLFSASREEELVDVSLAALFYVANACFWGFFVAMVSLLVRLVYHVEVD